MIKQGTRVSFKKSSTLEGTGVVCGLSTISQLVIGRGYIIRLDRMIDGYDYTHISLLEEMFEIIES
jgi:hypothetical protein